jgi:trans-2,3-dihydro-3-hydroxyanthranilate isomerase
VERHYGTVDVFADAPFGGNPLAVVLNADGLSTAQMQAVASEFNYAETTFVLPPGNPAHTAQVRIFTPRTELAFAGHPNIGTAFLLAGDGLATGDTLLFEETAGLVPVAVWREGGTVVGAELTAPEPLSRRTVLSPDIVAACLGLDPGDILTTTHPPMVASVGLPFVIVAVASRAALRQARYDLAAYERLFPLDGANAIFFYTPDGGAGFDLHSRMLSPLDGIYEDPATGSANRLPGRVAGGLRPGSGLRRPVAAATGPRHGPPERTARPRAAAAVE